MDAQAGLISVVLPVHNERENLGPLLEEISDALSAESYEIVAVDDCSTDGSIQALQTLADRRVEVRLVRLPQRAGQSAALIAGFEEALGTVVVTLDADGQNDPRDIPKLLRNFRASDGPTAVVGVRVHREVGRWKRLQAGIANRTRDLITGDRVRDTGCALRVARREDLLKLPRFKGVHRFIPTLLRREGVTVQEVPVSDRPRRHGSSKYGMWNRVFIGLIDAWGVRWLCRRALRTERRPPNLS